MKVWITKYALSSGVFIDSAELETADSIVLTGWPIKHCYRKPDWHETEADALARVEAMADAKIKSLQKQMAKVASIGVDAIGGKLPMAKERINP